MAFAAGCAAPAAPGALAFPWVADGGEVVSIPAETGPSIPVVSMPAFTPTASATAPRRPTLQGADEDVDEESWEVDIAPYLWATSINGSVTVKGTRSKIDSSFSDLLESVDYALQGGVLVSHDGIHFLGDLTYIVLDADASAGAADVDISGHISIVQAAVGVDINDDPTLMAFVGARYWDVTVKPSLTPGPNLSGSEDWIDPIVGARKIWPLKNQWEIQAIGDVGGYVGDSSDLTWQAAILGVRKTDHGNFVLGYRVLFVDYETGSGADKFKFDNTLYGPMVGWVFRF
jgi:hypothetical protein